MRLKPRQSWVCFRGALPQTGQEPVVLSGRGLDFRVPHPPVQPGKRLAPPGARFSWERQSPDWRFEDLWSQDSNLASPFFHSFAPSLIARVLPTRGTEFSAVPEQRNLSLTSGFALSVAANRRIAHVLSNPCRTNTYERNAYKSFRMRTYKIAVKSPRMNTYTKSRGVGGIMLRKNSEAGGQVECQNGKNSKPMC